MSNEHADILIQHKPGNDEFIPMDLPCPVPDSLSMSNCQALWNNRSFQR